jgi:hypothetical protein
MQCTLYKIYFWKGYVLQFDMHFYMHSYLDKKNLFLYKVGVTLAQVNESGVCHHLDDGVELTANDGPRPWLRGVDGYRHTGLAHFSHRGPWTAGNSRLERRPCSRDGGVHRIALSGTPSSAGPWNKASHPRQGRSAGSRPCLSENTTTNTSLILNANNSEKEIQKLYNAYSTKEKAKMELFPKDSNP